MWNDYFERKDRDDRRWNDWARLDAALAEAARANRPSKRERGSLRVVMGHAMIRAGTWMAGDPPVQLNGQR